MATIPNSILQYRPEVCCEVKVINGHYYVYRYQAIKLKSGRWGKKSGPCIGTIISNQGFCPNKNFNATNKDEITILEYGQYAFISSVSKEVADDLANVFPLQKAMQIYSYALILYANNFAHMDQISSYYEQCWLSLEYKDFTFKLGRTALTNLLDNLGRRETNVIKYERAGIEKSSKEFAIDGHVIRSCSEENDLAEPGYKFRLLKDNQVNLMMVYDINTEKPLSSRIHRGSENDKATISETDEILQFIGVLSVVDRGFYSKKNLEILSKNGNEYIVTVPSNTQAYQIAMSESSYTDEFYYKSGKKHARIEYRVAKISDTENVYVFRDIDENEKSRFNYLHQIELGVSGYTYEQLEKIKEFFGVYILQSNNKRFSANEIFNKYKSRWKIETFYQYVRNKGDFNNLMIQDYYIEQGFAFIMLIVGQIHNCVNQAVKSLKNNTISIYDILLMARRMKLNYKNGIWVLRNTRTKDLEILSKMGFIPINEITE